MTVKNSNLVLIHALIQIVGLLISIRFLADFLINDFAGFHTIHGLFNWVSVTNPPKIQLMLEYALIILFVSIFLFFYISENKKENYSTLSRNDFLFIFLYETLCFTLWTNLLGSILIVAPLIYFWLKRVKVVYDLSTPFLYILILSISLLALSRFEGLFSFNDQFNGMEVTTKLDRGDYVSNIQFIKKDSYLNKLFFKGCVYETKDIVLGCYPDDSDSEKNYSKGSKGSRKTIIEYFEKIKSADNGRDPLIDSFIFPTSSVENNTGYVNYDSEDFLSKNKQLLLKQNFFSSAFDILSEDYLMSIKLKSFNWIGLNESRVIQSNLLLYINKKTNSINFNKYLNLMFNILLFYLLILGLIVFFITRNHLIVILFFISSIFLLIFQSNFNLINLIAKFNPTQHFLDVVALFVVYYDIIKKSYFSYVSKIFIVLLFVWWNVFFGISLLLSIILCDFLDYFDEGTQFKKLTFKVLLELSIFIIVFYFLWLHHPNNYWMVTLAQNSYIPLVAFLGLMSAITFIRFTDKAAAYVNSLRISGVAITYFIFVFGLSSNDLPFLEGFDILLIATIIILTSNFSYFRSNKKIGAIISILLLPSLIIYILTKYYLFYQEDKFNNSSHYNYLWSFEGVKLKSINNPSQLQEAVQLIQKYQPVGNLQIISKYENMIRVAINRPGLFLNSDWISIASSKNNSIRLIEKIKASKPKYIFIEDDLSDNLFLYPNINFNSNISQYMMGLLKYEFLYCYSPLEKSGLLTVWQRSCEVVDG